MADTPTAAVELERAYDRDDLASVFRAFATALEDGTAVRIDGDDGSATARVAPRVAVELEVERDADDDPPVAGLEFDLEWDDPDGSSVRFDADADDAGPVIGRDAHRGTNRSTDPAMATMPADGVPGTREREGDRESASRSDAAPASESVPESESDAGTRSTGRTSRFEIYEDRGGEWRWRLVHWNGNIIADSGEGYASRSNAKRAARSVMRSAPTASITNRDADDGLE